MPPKKGKRKQSTEKTPLRKKQRAEADFMELEPKRQKNEVTGFQRRLDGLARLLALDKDCAAVCYDKNNHTLLVTHNAIYNNSHTKEGKQSKTMANIIMILNFLMAGNEEKETAIEILNIICMKSLMSALTRPNSPADILLYKSFIENYIGCNETAIVKTIIKQIYDLDVSRNWILQDLDYFANNLKEDEKNDWSLAKEGKKISVGRLSLIRKNLINIQKIYQDCWHLIRDFKKTIEFASENKFADIQLIAVGEKGEHAEMRMIGYHLLKNNFDGDNISLYIGISKLCCVDCQSVINIVNKTEDSKVKTTSSEDEESVGIQSVIQVRGEHGLQFPWKKPCYMNDGAHQKYTDNAKYYSLKNAQWETNTFPNVSEKTQFTLRKVIDDYREIKLTEKLKLSNMQASPSDSSHDNEQFKEEWSGVIGLADDLGFFNSHKDEDKGIEKNPNEGVTSFLKKNQN